MQRMVTQQVARREKAGAAHGDTAGHPSGVLAEPVFCPGVLGAVAEGLLAQKAAHIAFQQGPQAAEAIVISAGLAAAAPLVLGILPEEGVAALPPLAFPAPPERQGGGQVPLLDFRQAEAFLVVIECVGVEHITFSIHRIAVW